ncbi:MAG: ZIP family metal transporter [Parcubacteria group bacterium]|nr:ZIP family metal transporter [Parcubacteria group bacterium]|tara:strand:- start:20271 stop:21017 length:747 start_codon:yes stop_codon:yes gene_type:complete
MTALIYSLGSAIIIATISIIGIITLALSDKLVKKILIFLVSFSAGSLMGSAFFHLLPEALAETSNFLNVSIFILGGFCTFFILERILHWHHCHKVDCDTHRSTGHINLIGDAIHNIIDGLVIISAFAVSPVLGLPVVLSIALHEIPQEISDFGILLFSGWKKTKAILFNFIIALFILAGVIIGFLLLDKIDGLTQFLLPFAAGGFIYISATDLIPEIRQETDLPKSILSFIIFLVGLGLMLGLKLISG